VAALSEAEGFLGLRVRIPPRAWVSVSRQCLVLTGRGFCVGLITHPEESYTECGVSECDREVSTLSRPWPSRGCGALKIKGKS
jgi:hypothetical protein